MSRYSTRFGVGALAAAAAVASGTPASAVEITLRMKNGDFQIGGELVAYDKSKYTIKSQSLGEMSLDASRFDCLGASCPTDVVVMKTEPPALIAAAGPIKMSISGSNTVGNQLMPSLIEAYAAKTKAAVTKVAGANPLDLDFRFASSDGKDAGIVSLHRHGSSTAFTDLETKAANIGMSSRPVKAEEVQKLATAGLPDLRQPGSEHVLALDGLVVLVAPENPMVSIPADTIAKVFSGQITDWSQLGLPAGAINVYAPTKESGTFDTFESLVLKPAKLELAANAKRTANHAEQADWVARDPMGIGFTGMAYQRNAKALNIQTACGLILQPSNFSVKTEEYPLSRRLFLYTPGEPRDPHVRNLVAFALSPEAQPIVKKADFIDQLPETTGYDSQTGRIASALNAEPANFDENLMQTYTTDIKTAQRLSVTFRFQSGSYVLDNKALADAGRLVELLKSEPYNQKSILLAGYADTQGLFADNLDLSKKRAQAVLSVLKKNGLPAGAHVAVKGYSELAPAACNDKPENLQLNRRVEVWVN